MLARKRWLVLLLMGFFPGITFIAVVGFNGLPTPMVGAQAQGTPPPEEALHNVTSEFIQYFDLPIGEITITLHAEITTENAATLAAELAQATRVLYFARPPINNSPSLYVTFSVPENADWLIIEPTLPELEQQLREEVLLPGRQVYLLKWESAVTTEDGQPMPPELSFLAASFQSLAVYDSTKGVVYDSIMALPVIDLTSIQTSSIQVYLPFVANQAQPTSTMDTRVTAAPRIDVPLKPTYSEDPTHWLMGRQAAILAGIDPPYTEIGESAIIDQIADGDQAEDNPVLSDTQHMKVFLPPASLIDVEVGDGRFFHHFYDPNSTSGLPWKDWFHGLVLLSIKESIASGKPVRFMKRPSGDIFSSALEWGRNQHTDGLDWKHAIEMYDYSASSKQLAYRWLGHVVHLIQDMAQPDHPRLQPHPGSGMGVPVPVFNQGLVKMVGYEKLWDELSDQWPTAAWPGCPNQGTVDELDDFFNSMASRSIEQSGWWENGYKVPKGNELALGLTNLSDLYATIFPSIPGLWDPEVLLHVLNGIPLGPTIPLNSPGNFRTMGETLISEAVACSAALLRFYYDIVNYPPYVVEVIVTQPGAGFPEDIAYHARWEDQWETVDINDLSSGQQVTVTRLKERQLEILRAEPLQGNTPAIIEVRFGPYARDHGGASKELDEDSIQVQIIQEQIGEIGVTKLAFGRDGADGPAFWRGGFTPDILGADMLRITISASDTHNHFANRAHNGSMLDSNPQTAAKASSSGPDYQWDGYEPGADRNHRLSVHRFLVSHHNTVVFENQDADAILAEGSGLLQAIDGPGDVACPVRMIRDEDVSVFTVGTGVINTLADQDIVMALPGNVKVVSQLNYCYPTFAMNLIGCAELPGDSFIVEDIGPYPRAGVLWAHAFGNNQGLQNCQANCLYRLMNYFIVESNRIIDANECAAFLQPRPAAQLNEFLPSVPQAPEDSEQRTDVREFVHRLYIHGVLYQNAIQYGTEEVDILINMLQDPAEEPYWSNIVITLGMIGDEKAIEPLLQFINKDAHGELSPSHYKAITGAIGSLGYLLNKSGNQKALTYLQESLDPNVWTERVPSWTSPFHLNVEERNIQLSIMAIIGLGLSGHPEAEKSLRSLQEPATTLESQEFQRKTSEVVNEALRALEFIAKEGLSQYYEQSSY
ncbi:MAG TPA: hypothetical protein VJ124_24265 [Pyrinomonadaceae bacterium]|nr:hypothetical protein [Pyrinomonadaceae bacterium]